jgi:hypothetical protein
MAIDHPTTRLLMATLQIRKKKKEGGASTFS